MEGDRNQEGKDNGEIVLGSENDHVDKGANSTDQHSSNHSDHKANSDNTRVAHIPDKDDDDEVDISCGIWKFRTNIFGTWFSNLYVFAICVGISSLFSAMVGEILQIQLPSIERQFNIDNARAGLFDTAFKAGYLFSVLLAGHFTKKAHIPVVVGLSGVVQGIILLVPPILQFVDPYELPLISSTDNSTDNSENEKYICRSSELNQTISNFTSENKEVNKMAYNVLMVLQALKGVCDVFQSGFLTLIYMDDNAVDKSKMGILLGIQTLFQTIAGPLGKEVNGIISSIPIDLKDTEMSPKDHRFVSAWWLGFLIFGLGTVIFSIPVMLFPRRLISKRQQKNASDKAVADFDGGHTEEKRVKSQEGVSDASRNRNARIIDGVLIEESHKEENELPTSNRKQSVSSHLANASRRRSSVYLSVIDPTERKLSFAGSVVLEESIKQTDDSEEGPEDGSYLELIKDFPKALYRIFRKPMFLLLLLDVTIGSIPYAGMLFFRSTYMAFEYNVPMSKVAFYTGIANAIANIGGAISSSWLSSRVTTKVGYVLIVFLTYLIATCMTPLYFVYGCDNQQIYGAPGEIGIPINSSDICTCDSMGQLLSCGDDSNIYFSPCYAGCSDVRGNIFTNCSLLSENPGGTSLTPGLCASDCDRNFNIYVFVHGLQNFVTATCIIAYKLLILRSVEPQDRGFGISVYMFFYIILSIPTPNLFGRVFDNACYINDGDSCVYYDRDTIRYLIAGIDFSMHACSQITCLTMLTYLKWEQRRQKKKQAKKQSDATDMKIPDKLDPESLQA